MCSLLSGPSSSELIMGYSRFLRWARASSNVNTSSPLISTDCAVLPSIRSAVCLTAPISPFLAFLISFSQCRATPCDPRRHRQVPFATRGGTACMSACCASLWGGLPCLPPWLWGFEKQNARGGEAAGARSTIRKHFLPKYPPRSSRIFATKNRGVREYPCKHSASAWVRSAKIARLLAGRSSARWKRSREVFVVRNDVNQPGGVCEPARQRRQSFCHGGPEDVAVDIEIGVHKTITHADY